MNKYISIFGKKVKRFNFVYYTVFIILFSIYSFIQKPFIQKIYSREEIKNFEDNNFWKVYIVIFIIVLISGLYFVKKTKENIASFIFPTLFGFLLVFFFIRGVVTTNALYINQLHSKGKNEVIYRVLKMENLIILDNENESNDFVDRDELKYIDEIRLKNHQESLFQKKNGDTLKIVFDKGIFGFNYLK